MKHKFCLIIFSLSVLFASCEYDPNEGIDHISPKAYIERDTLEVPKGGSVDLNAVLKDPSGISYISLSYSSWKISEELSFEIGKYKNEYTFQTTIIVPTDALSEWEEEYIKHDGSRFKIRQKYHKISLTCLDGVRNSNTFYFYIKAI